MRRIAVLDAPSNLGLRPPTETSVPGCAKAPGALRDHGLLTKLNARDAGCLTPPRYDPGDWRPGDGVAHAPQIAAYSRALADRIGAILDAGEFPVVLGGDCSILLGSGVAMHRLGEAVGGRIGLVFVDGHSDFRHPGNASYVGAAAGEDLALVTGRGQPDLAAIEGRRPYFRDVDVVVMGLRAQDEYRLDLQAAGIVTRPVPALRAEGAARSAQWARDQLVDCAGYWVHVDVDVLDPAVMPAVDAPSPGGIAFPELELLLTGLVESPHCLGVELTVFDPDYDTDGSYAAEIVSAVTAGLAAAHTVTPRPDLIAARADLSGSAAEDPERTRRRADAASGSVPLAAAGMSAGLPGAAAQTAVPATTVLGVGEAGDLPARAVSAPVQGDDDPFDDDDYYDDETVEDDGADPEAAARPEPAGQRPEPTRSWPDLTRLRPESPHSGQDSSRSEPDSARFGQPPSRLRRGPADRWAQAADDPESAAEAEWPDDHDPTAEPGRMAGPGAMAEPGHVAELGPSAEWERVAEPDHVAGPARPSALGRAAEPDRAAEREAELDRQAELERVAEAEHAPEAERAAQEERVSEAEHAAEEERVSESEHAAEAERVAAPGLERAAGAADDPGPEAAGSAAPDGDSADEDAETAGARLVPRPLGSAPLLDSEPLPATRPGMLRPRPVDDATPDRFSLPAQRPAFDLGSGEPADIA